jgi:hypothetical protein
MRIALIVIGTLVVLVLAMAGVGALLPVRHVAMRTASIAAPVDTIWRMIDDVAAYPAWRSGVKRVELLAPVEGRPSFREHGKDGAITFVVDQADGPTKRVTRIADRSLPFGGSWTFDLRPAGVSTEVTITENGEVYNVLFRFMSRYFFGHDATIKRYLSDLEGAVTRTR